MPSISAAIASLLCAAWLTQTAAAADSTSGTSSAASCCGACAAAAPTDCTLRADVNPVLVADKDGTATGSIRVCNHSATSVPWLFSVSTFQARAPKESNDPMSYPVASTVDFTATDVETRADLGVAKALDE